MSENIWDRIMSDDEWVTQVKKLSTSRNDSVSLKACQWIGEGKGFISSVAGAGIDEIKFVGVDDEQIQDVDN